MLVASPTIWAVHFLASYVTAAIWCAKFAGEAGSLAPARFAIAVYTVGALLGIGWTGWLGYRRGGLRQDTMPHDDPSPVDRYRFFGSATLLLSLLSGVATLFVAAVILFVETCD